MQPANFIARLVNLFVGLAVGILAIRVLFRLFNANATVGFVDWIYDTSDSLMAPFRGIFPPQELVRGYVLDVSALFAILMYVIIGFVVIGFLSLVPGSTSVKK